MYIWGHTFELNVDPKRWEQFEEFCEIISGKEDILWYKPRTV